MSLSKHQFFQLPDIETTSRLQLALAKRYGVVKADIQLNKIGFFDSFDWRLFKKNLFLVAIDNRLRLSDSLNQKQYDVEVEKADNIFWWDLPEGQLQERLRPVLSCRALSLLTESRLRRENFRLTNKDGKTVVRLSVCHYLSITEGEEAPLAVFAEIRGVRGYDSVYKKVRKIVVGLCGEPVLYGPERLTSVLRNTSRTPLDYSNKYSVALGREWSVARVFSVICLDLLQSMKQNHQAVLDDIDTEFLHDFRVAVRRTRSFLSLMKKVLPGDIRHFMTEFKWVGSITGPVRDLDVYLLKQDDYQVMLPKTLQAGLPHFFSDLVLQREQVFQRMFDELQSERFCKLMDGWHSYLTGFETAAGSGAWLKPCRPLAVSLVNKRFKRIIRDGNRIDDTSEDELLHDLRIQAKKFRYLLEFFTPYFKKKDVKRFVKQLKKLQNNLGDFNDLSVQQSVLGQYQKGLRGRSMRDIQVAAALGGLITSLASEQEVVRNNFKQIFKRFTEKENNQLFRQTFKNKHRN